MLAKIQINQMGSIFFYDENDDWHRLDGPAVQFSDGFDQWWIHGVFYSEEEFNEIVGGLC